MIILIYLADICRWSYNRSKECDARIVAMKVTRERAEENHQRVIEVASRLYRENGFDGASVADIMKGAGLTHGGFYAQFKSKDDLAAKASVRGFAQTLAKVRERARASRGD